MLLEQISVAVCVAVEMGVFHKECREEENALKLGVSGRGQRVIKYLLCSLFLGE